MDPNPTTYPILSYVLARLPSFGPKPPASTSTFDIEQPPSPSPQQPRAQPPLPQLTNPALLSSMTRAITDVAQARSVLQTLGPRPDHEKVDNAKVELSKIESKLSKKLEGLVLSPRPVEIDRLEWRAYLEEKEKIIREEAEKERGFYTMVLQLEEMHADYDKMLKDAEERLVKIYERGEDEVEEEAAEVVCEDVVGILKEGKGMARVDLSNRKLRFLPEAFGRVAGLKVLNLSNNQLEVCGFFK